LHSIFSSTPCSPYYYFFLEVLVLKALPNKPPVCRLLPNSVSKGIPAKKPSIPRDREVENVRNKQRDRKESTSRLSPRNHKERVFKKKSEVYNGVYRLSKSITMSFDVST
jgi:hypothetical protein